MRWLLLFIIGLAIHFALRMTYANVVQPDDADLILFSQKFAWGYSDQSPLYSWILEAIFALFGVGVIALTVMRVLVLFALGMLLYANARMVCANQNMSLLCVGTVLLIPNLSWHALSYLTHSNLLMVTTLFCLWTFLRLMRNATIPNYFIFGLACGLGVLSKYNFVWFVVALGVAGMTVPEARRRLLNWKFLLAVGVGALTVLPHAVWLWQHLDTMRDVLGTKVTRADEEALSYFQRVKLGAGDALSAIILTMVLAIIVVMLTFRGSDNALSVEPQRSARLLLGRILLVGLAVIALQIFGLGSSRFHERWLLPFAVVLPIWLFSRIKIEAVTPARRLRFTILLALLALGYTVARGLEVTTFVEDRRGAYPLKMDFQTLADDIATRTGTTHGEGLSIITSEREIGGNLLLELPHARVCCTAEKLYPLQPRPGDAIVIAWNPDIYQQTTILYPPWLLLDEFATLYGEPPIPPESVHVINVAPAYHSEPAVRIAYIILNRD